MTTEHSAVCRTRKSPIDRLIACAYMHACVHARTHVALLSGGGGLCGVGGGGGVVTLLSCAQILPAAIKGDSRQLCNSFFIPIPTNPPTNQSASQPVSQSASQPASQPANQPANQQPRCATTRLPCVRPVLELAGARPPANTNAASSPLSPPAVRPQPRPARSLRFRDLVEV